MGFVIRVDGVVEAVVRETMRNPGGWYDAADYGSPPWVVLIVAGADFDPPSPNAYASPPAMTATTASPRPTTPVNRRGELAGGHRPRIVGRPEPLLGERDQQADEEGPEHEPATARPYALNTSRDRDRDGVACETS